MIILSGCDKSPPQPDTWEKMMANTMGVPQNSWRLHTSMRGRIRIIYIFQKMDLLQIPAIKQMSIPHNIKSRHSKLKKQTHT